MSCNPCKIDTDKLFKVVEDITAVDKECLLSRAHRTERENNVRDMICFYCVTHGLNFVESAKVIKRGKQAVYDGVNRFYKTKRNNKLYKVLLRALIKRMEN